MSRRSLPSLLLAALACSPAVAQLQANQPQADSVTFGRRHAAVGDQSEQTVAVRFDLKATTRSGDKVLGEALTQMTRNQKRVVTTTEVGPKGPRSATVDYVVADRQTVGAPAKQEPVAGKHYRCTRQGEQLLVTTADGAMPPLDEYKIVAANMETLGRTNPLAEFLGGRTVAVGQQLELPNEVAARLLGFEEQLASTKRFTLRLTRVVDVGGRTCAEFQTEIEAGSGTTGQMGLIVTGPLVLEAAGCRAVSADLAGPIGVSETRSSPGGTVQVTGAGKLQIALRSRYRNVQ